MATVCLTGETMKKAIRSAPNQTKITLVPSLKKESSFDLFEAFEVGTNEGATFQNIPSCSIRHFGCIHVLFIFHCQAFTKIFSV